MLRMRLQRRGKKNYATYRVVVADKRAPIKGKFLADLGRYNPHTDTFEVNTEKIHEWINKGTQPSATVHNLLVTHDIIKADKVTSWRAKVKEGNEEGAAQAAETKVSSKDASGEAADKSADTQTAESDSKDDK